MCAVEELRSDDHTAKHGKRRLPEPKLPAIDIVHPFGGRRGNPRAVRIEAESMRQHDVRHDACRAPEHHSKRIELHAGCNAVARRDEEERSASCDRMKSS